MRLARVFLSFGFAHASLLLGQVSSFEERVERLFRPPLAEQMALSPDGRRVAYTTQDGQELHVIILDLENPRGKVTLNVDNARVVLFSKEKQHAQLRFLRWATADRLVMAPTEERIMLPTAPSISFDEDGLPRLPAKVEYEPQITAPIMAVDADGSNPTTLVEADARATEAPQIYGFVRDQREQLIVRLPLDWVSVNVHTGRQTTLDSPGRGSARGSDGRFTLTGSTRAEIEQDLAAKFPYRRLELIDWTGDAQHVLVHVTGGSDPGRVFVFQRAHNLLVEIFRNAPWLDSAHLNETRFVEFDPTPGGPRLSVYVTWPRTSRLKPPPVLVCFPSGFPGKAQPEFDPEAQVFADLGFVVVRLNHRYVKGVAPYERDALLTGLDRLPVDDAASVIKALAGRFPEHPFDAKHVAALGRGFGGYLAVRALQLRPEVFRAGIAIDAPMDLRRWLFPAAFFIEGTSPTDIPRGIFGPDSVELERLSIAGHAASLKQPVFFLLEPARSVPVEMGVSAVRSELNKLHQPADYLELDPGFALALPKARVVAYRKIEEFFNLRLYDYRVKIGPTTEVK